LNSLITHACDFLLQEFNTDEVVNETGTNPFGLTVEQYFNPKINPNKDVGRLRNMTSKTQKFSATVALSDSFPLSLQDQVLPIINLMVSCYREKYFLSTFLFVKIYDFERYTYILFLNKPNRVKLFLFFFRLVFFVRITWVFDL